VSHYVLTRRAPLDLIEITDYIADRDPNAAERPGRDDIRFWLVGRYLIVYQGREDSIEVIRVLRASRDIATMLR
jgi:plasmid stabilization system protein ParE